MKIFKNRKLEAAQAEVKLLCEEMIKMAEELVRSYRDHILTTAELIHANTRIRHLVNENQTLAGQTADLTCQVEKLSADNKYLHELLENADVSVIGNGN